MAAEHRALNQYLVRVEQAGWQTAIQEVNGIRDKRLNADGAPVRVHRCEGLTPELAADDCLAVNAGRSGRVWICSRGGTSILTPMEIGRMGSAERRAVI